MRFLDIGALSILRRTTKPPHVAYIRPRKMTQASSGVGSRSYAVSNVMTLSNAAKLADASMIGCCGSFKHTAIQFRHCRCHQEVRQRHEPAGYT